MRAIVFISCLLLLLAADKASAQVRRYTPPGGRTLPGELNYFRRDTGILDPYNAFVRPQRNLRQDLRTLAERQEEGEELQAELRLQDRETLQQLRLRDEEALRGLRSEVGEGFRSLGVRMRSTAEPSGGGSGGTHARFNNYSHFYQTPTPQRTNRRQ